MHFQYHKNPTKKEDWLHLPNYCNHNWLINMNKNWNNVTFATPNVPYMSIIIGHSERRRENN